jgi:Holliday junction resolvasome RuvABC endonuclease subunit
MLLFSIDVGIVNIGVAMVDSETKKIVYADKIQLASKAKLIKNMTQITNDTYQLLFSTTSKYNAMIQKSSIVLIEQQMKNRLTNIQMTIGAFCKSIQKPFVYVSPRSVKTFYKLGKPSRKQKESKKASHTANKKAAVQYVRKRWPEIISSFDSSKQDDIADAILQAMWYIESIKIKKK